jgi:heat shock protein HtpX
MFETILGFFSTYLSLALITTVLSMGSFTFLNLSDNRSYHARTTLLILPMVGGVLIELWQGIPCILHQISLGTNYIEHLLCGVVPFATQQGTCFTWVATIGISLSITGITWGFNHNYGYKVVKRIHGFKQIGHDEAGDLYSRLEDLASKVGIEKPTLSLIESSKPTIFSIGHSGNVIIFLSVGLLEALSDEEVTSVLAHEIAHCKNHDSDLKTLISSLRYVTFNPLGILFESAISREREFLADAGASKLVGGPNHLISALMKLSSPLGTNDQKNQINSLMSFNSLDEFRWRIFSKHPIVDERISRLLQL